MRCVVWVVVVLLSCSCGRRRYSGDDTDAASVLCGNGQIDGDEECDDGNSSDTDACTSACLIARCGDAFIRENVEVCDDGNTVDGDGCAGNCQDCERGNQAFAWADGEYQCYSRHDVSLGWNDGNMTCRAIGGHLVTYGSGAENSAVVDNLSPDGDYIGHNMRWVTFEPQVYANWVSEFEPLFNCAFQLDAGTWQTDDCSPTRGFLCESSPWVIRPSDGHAYRAFYDCLDWGIAQQQCRNLGAEMLVIDDAAEQTFVTGLSDEDVWVGARDLDLDGTFENPAGEPITYSNWGPSSPENGIDCAFMETSTGTWNSRECVPSCFAYICEMP